MKHHHIQEEQSSAWIITHALNKTPMLDVFAIHTEGGSPRKIHPLRIEYTSSTAVTVFFNQPKKGFAFLS